MDTRLTVAPETSLLKKKQNCEDLVIAVPVAPPDAVNRLIEIVEYNDRVIVIYSPKTFIAVGQLVGASVSRMERYLRYSG